MHAAEHKRRSEPAAARRRDIERHFISSKQLQPAPQPFQLGGDAGAGAAGIDQTSVGIVVGEQQRAEIGPPALGIGPADDDKFPTVQAFDLELQAAVARRVGGIGAFRDDALELQFAGPLVERRTLVAVVIAVVQTRPDAGQQRALRSISGRAATSSPSRCRRSKMKNTSPAALPASDAAWIMPNEVMPSGKTPHSSPSPAAARRRRQAAIAASR